MAITYPITLPISGLISSLRFSAVSIVASFHSPFTGQQQVQAHQGQFWQVDITLDHVEHNDAVAISAALTQLNGKFGTFLFGDPTMTSPRGSGSGSPTVNGANQTGQELATQGWTPSAQNVLLAGDWIQLGSGATQRIYRVLKDVNANASGQATIDIWPRLRESPANGAPIVLNNTQGVFRLLKESSWEIDPPAIYGFDISAIEAI